MDGDLKRENGRIKADEGEARFQKMKIKMKQEETMF